MIVILLVLLIGVLCSSACIKRDLSLSRLLETRGCRWYYQSFFEYISFAAVSVITLILLFLGFIAFAQDSHSLIPELQHCTRTELFWLFIRFIPSVLLVCAMQFLVYELCSDLVSGTLLQFVVSVGLAYVSGCIYPVGFFPESLQIASSYLPIGFSFEQMKKAVLGIADFKSIVICIGYCLVLVMLSALIRRVKIRSSMS